MNNILFFLSFLHFTQIYFEKHYNTSILTLCLSKFSSLSPRTKEKMFINNLINFLKTITEKVKATYSFLLYSSLIFANMYSYVRIKKKVHDLF